jgi:DNA-binding NtrC family response regulator
VLLDVFRSASTAEEAAPLLTRRAFDLILTDLLLPGASSLELCRLAQAKCPEAEVIVMSGSTDLQHEIDAARSGAFDYLRKPFTLSRLEGALRQSLRCQALCRELHSLTAKAG